MNKSQLISSLRDEIESYKKKTQKPSRPWFFDGKPGKAGLERLGRAQELLTKIDKTEISSEQVLYEICKFYSTECDLSIWRSRLLDGIGRVLDRQLGTVWNPSLVLSASAALRQVEAHDRARWGKINSVIESYEAPQELQSFSQTG